MVSWPSWLSGVFNTELDKVSSRDHGVVSTVAEIDGKATSWRRVTVTLMTMGLNGLNNRPWWGANRERLGVLRFTLVIATLRSVATSFDQSWAYFLVWFENWKVKSTDQERIHDGWLLQVDYSRTLTAREKFLLLLFSTWLAEKESMLQDRRDSRQGTNWSRIPNRPFTRKEG
jgi:hypothetical protein